MQTLCAENPKTPVREIGEDVSNRRATAFTVAKLQPRKDVCFPKLTGRSDTIPSKTHAGFFLQHQTRFSNIYMEMRRNWNGESNFEKEDEVGGISLSDFKTCEAAAAIRPGGTGGGTDAELHGTPWGTLRHVHTNLLGFVLTHVPARSGGKGLSHPQR